MLLDSEVAKVQIYVDEQSFNTITIPIVGDILAPEEYNDVVYYLRNAQPQDTVKLLINSNGGIVAGALHIVAAMEECQAPIEATITSDCGSAATLIFFAASSWRVPEFSTMLIHSTSYGTGGMTNHMLQTAQHEKGHLLRICELFYKGFLTQKEIEGVVKGDQLYFLSEEIGERLKKRIKMQMKEQEEIDA